ncbi:sigma-54 dependent transcriptional regulator [Seleniivibrio woodruffii]|uniref:sigma-54-dependent transcriptional regulator n=1 Tax=Seleniivibrio woodruffii TaxID=1078050 RepID=UPI0026F0CCFC|nr:sigma-54 dependent transcriptional regulator [Seleniivibrio woodruffii]
MIDISIVDDEDVLTHSLKMTLEYWGYRVTVFDKGSLFLEHLKTSSPDIVFLDICLPDSNGIDVLKVLNEKSPDSSVVMITAHGNVRTAIEAIKLGAYDYLNKPFEMDEIKLIIEKILCEIRLYREVEMRREREYKYWVRENMVISCGAMNELLKRAETVASADSTTVIMRGESGTGKDLLAKTIHNMSARASKPFIEVNCASFPENLLEMELFGYEKGAFTDAKTRKNGLIEIADGGTIFFDEIGELSPFMQAKLLKFLESHTFRRLGGVNEIKVDVRVISSTNKNLEEAVKSGEFRSDLYYRLSVFPLEIPPLRERGEDIILLAEYYLSFFAKKFGKPAPLISDDAKNSFISYSWPGNVRELKNICERITILSTKRVIAAADLPQEMFGKEVYFRMTMDRVSPFSGSIDDVLMEIEKEMVADAMKRADGVKQSAAKLLGISRHALIRKLKRLN